MTTAQAQSTSETPQTFAPMEGEGPKTDGVCVISYLHYPLTFEDWVPAKSEKGRPRRQSLTIHPGYNTNIDADLWKAARKWPGFKTRLDHGDIKDFLTEKPAKALIVSASEEVMGRPSKYAQRKLTTKAKRQLSLDREQWPRFED